MEPSERGQAQRARLRELIEAELLKREQQDRKHAGRTVTRSPLVVIAVVVAVLIVLSTAGNWGDTGGGLFPATTAPAIPADDAIVEAVAGAFDEPDPEHRCTPRGATPSPALELGDTPYVGCLVRGDYADLDGRPGRALVAFLYPPADLTTLTEGDSGTIYRDPVLSWVSWPGSVLGEWPTTCEDWRTLDHAVPGAAQAVGCARQNALTLDVRVAAASEDLLVVVDLSVDVDPAAPDAQVPDPARLRPLAAETARLMLTGT